MQIDERALARAGAELEAIAIVTEFPDILARLNALAKPATNGRVLSAAARQRISTAQKRRWAKQRRER